MSFGVCFFSTLFTLTSILQQSSLDYTWDFAQAHPDFRTDIFLLGEGTELTIFDFLFLLSYLKKLTSPKKPLRLHLVRFSLH